MAHTKWMVKEDTRVVFAFNPGRFLEGGFFEYTGTCPPIDKAAGCPILRDSYHEDDVIPPPPTAEEIRALSVEGQVFENHVERLVKVMRENLKRIDWATQSGIPQVTTLQKYAKFQPTREERDEAYSRYQLAKNSAAIGIVEAPEPAEAEMGDSK